jgi:hypothetical protein
MSTTRNRVPINTSVEINRRIQDDIARNVKYYAAHPSRIPERLRQLDEEWDIERAIEANAAVVGLLGTVLSITNGRRWLVLPALVSGFLLQHAVEGWCPPVPVLRRLGFRTSFEIDEERQALKALRGDYLQADESDDEALRAAKAGTYSF